ncbi:MAG: envelope stress response membrane protein PspB [Rhodospirillales bacterium]|nr:MAG: envelope stress response membrane protein PspB [Rhodospirillales bacterium]TVR95436.1 MAG: envelope stress response membrane protein PspB [Rhodospirillales bacterium]
MGDFLYVPIILFMVVIAPIWIIAHYVTRWRTAKVLSAEDEKMLAELWDLAPKLESRINTLERILDAEAPDWRKEV